MAKSKACLQGELSILLNLPSLIQHFVCWGVPNWNIVTFGHEMKDLYMDAIVVINPEAYIRLIRDHLCVS